MKRTGYKRRRKRRRGKVVGADSAVSALLNKYGISGGAAESSVVAAWPTIVGQRIASRTWPAQITDGTLTVVVSSSSWMQQLKFVESELLESIRSYTGVGDAPVRALRFELEGRLRKQGGIDDRVRRPKPPQRHIDAPVDPIDDDLKATIERDSETVSDPELREIIARTRRRWHR